MVTIHGHRYLSAREFAAVSLGVLPDEITSEDVRKVYPLLEAGRVEGATKTGYVWIVPLETARHEVEAARFLAIAKAAALAELVGVE